eukprot:TRINITY_DN3709_c0_g1_i8.p1 TRINITY_DN3709_c0_g1~~TRINITY_DN3709_c0_g1_i8.p1  ORF type:complete len:686 (+),score=43.91 TRINITY_DN3709_c0_g1_i8:80-2059(+)
MGGILEYSSLSEYRKKQWHKAVGSKTQYHTSKVTLIPKQLHVHWRLQQVGATVLQAKKAQPYNSYLVQLALSCCAAWGYLVFSGIQQIKAKSESSIIIDHKQLQNQVASQYTCVDEQNNQLQSCDAIRDEVYLNTCCQDDDITMEDIRKIVKRGQNNEIDDLLDEQNSDDEQFFQNVYPSKPTCHSQNLNSNFNQQNQTLQVSSFWGGNIPINVQCNNFQQQYRQSYHNIAAVRYGSQGTHRIYVLPQVLTNTLLEEKQEDQFQLFQKESDQGNVEQQKLPKKVFRTKFLKGKKRAATIFYGIPDQHKNITEQFLDFYFQIGEISKKQLLNAVKDVPEISKERLMETITIFKTVLRLENQTEALKSIIKDPQVLKLNSILLKQRLKYWIVNQNLENAKILIAKNPACLQIPLLDVENSINYLWKRGVNNGLQVISQNSNLDWVTHKDVEIKFNQLEKLFGKRYCGYLISSAPWILQVDQKLIERNIQFLENMGFDQSQIVQIVKSSNQHLLKRFVDKKNNCQTFTVLLSYGLSENEVKNIIVQNPIVLQKNLQVQEQNVKIIYCEQYFKCDQKQIVKQCPQLFSYSLSDKIAARFEFLKVLKMKVGIEDLSRCLVAVSDEEFASLCQVHPDEYKKFLEGNWKKYMWPKIWDEIINQHSL